MRKDVLVRLAGLAIMLTLISSALVSGTYAKYASAVSGSDTVRVAKFAFNLTDNKTGAVVGSQSVGEAAFDIFSTTDDGLYDNGQGGTFIAPGTTGSFGLTLENLSEVDVTASFEFEETNAGNVPIYYTIGDNPRRYSSVLTGSYTDGEYADMYADMDAFEAAMAAETEVLQATDGTEATIKTVTVNWTWAFESAGAGQSDAKDTALGVGETATVTLDVKVSVEQSN
jgi:hypothetical protein